MSATALPQPSSSGRADRTVAWTDRGLTAVIAGLLVVLALGVGLRATGLSALVDYSGSMHPAIQAGDVVVDKAVRVSDLRAGQIASIPDPGFGNRLVTHRVVSVARHGATVTVITRGDANQASERWVLPAAAQVKRMIARVPWIGRVMIWLTAPLLRAILLLLGAVAVAAWGIRRLRDS